MIWDIDTRALVRHLRLHGALRAMVATDGTSAEQLIHEAKQLPSMAGQELASRVSTEKGYKWDTGSIELAISPWSEQMGEAGSGSEGGRKLRVAAYDFGIKQNILRLLIDHGCEVVVVPAQTPAEDVLVVARRWRVFVERSGRSRAGDIRGGKYSASCWERFRCSEFASGISSAGSRSAGRRSS